MPPENGVFPLNLTSQPQKCGHYSILKQWKSWTHVNPCVIYLPLFGDAGDRLK